MTIANIYLLNLNYIMTAMPKTRIKKFPAGLRLFSWFILLALLTSSLKAQIHPLVNCSITGATSVTLGATETYHIGPCTASSWSVSCGSVQSSTSSSVVVVFNVAGCSSATISAPGSTAQPLTVNITWPTLTGGTISNTHLYCNYNTSPAQINASVATGGDCFTYTYQWYSSPNNSTYTAISGATGQNYQPGTLTATTYYKREATCSSSSVYTTNLDTVTVYPQIVAGAISPSTQTINFNTAPSMLTLSGVSGGTGTYTYQWQSSPDNMHWTAVSGATGTTYTPGNLVATTYYNVAVTSNGAVANSTSALVTVNPEVLAGVITPSNLTITSGTSPGELDCSPASGGACSGAYSYQWQSSPNGTTFTNISGATSLTYTPGTLTANTWYQVVVTCGTETANSATCQITIGTASTSFNFIRIRNILKPGVMDTVTADGLTSVYDVSQGTKYYDGLGRTVQSVAKQSSPLQNDIVAPIVYDNFGRQSIQYMPYTATTNDGNYKPTALENQFTFNSAQFPGENYYYSQTNFEASPLNRVLNSYAPGMSWVGNGLGISAQYLTNTVNDSVQIWSISSVQFSIPTDAGAYQPGQLYKTITTDEAGHQIVQYTDKLGKTILKKQQVASSPSTGHYGWLCTYYVYDTLQNLRVIIQPQAIALINGSWAISQNIANELCFRYEYDGRRRMAIKKFPGAGQQWMVYDARDRVAMIQDSALRSIEKWKFIKYDAENRQDSTGFITDPTNYNNLAYHDSLAYYSTSYPIVSSYTNELLTLTFYDDYSWVSAYSAPVSASLATNYTTNSTYFITSYNTSPTYAVAVTNFPITHGMATGSMKKVIGTASQYLFTSNFYDDRARLIQVQSVNYTGAIDTLTVQYNFDGAELRSLLNHKKNGNTVQSHIVITKMDYDHRFRLRHIWKNIDGATNDQLIDSMQYNELGQLNAKYLGNNVDSLIYTYNIRGWLTGINKNYVAGTASHFFGLELGYNNTSSVAPGNTYITPEYNGNIEGTVWKSAGAGINRKYDYTYDNANRLSAAAYLQNTSGTSWDKTQVDFSVSNLSYDANGNILTMTQRGFTVGGSSPIDSLTYSYLNTNGSNKLMGVTDAANNDTSLLGDFHYNPATKQSTDYNYDGNGNLIQDNNKAISSITYNYLNLPQLVHMNAEGNVAYTYDAGGTRLSKVISDSTVRHTTTILYIAGFVYQQRDTITNPTGGIDTLQFIAHEEGRVRWAYQKYTTGATGYQYQYDFFEKDNMGNTRMVLTQERDTSNYLASMEAAYRTTEVQLFNNITSTCYPWASVPGSGSIPSGTKLAITNPNDSVSKVDYTGTTGQTSGPSLLLKVMGGDTISLAVQSYYNTNTDTTSTSSFSNVLNSLASALLTTPTGGAEGTIGTFTASTGPVYGGLTSFFNTDDPAPPTGFPKAHLNWIFLDDQFNYISSSSGSIAAASTTYPAATLNTVAPGSALTMPRNGYLYIWVSNETQNWDVFFDNLKVQYKTGPLLEENHYYPFGITMAGISDKAIKTNYSENKFRYNGGSELQNSEFSNGQGLQMYETNYRGLDPQLGRFTQIDPMSDQFHFFSSYQYALNNPVYFNDPEGLKSAPPGLTPAQQAQWAYGISQQFQGSESDGQFGGIPDVMGPGGSGGGGAASPYTAGVTPEQVADMANVAQMAQITPHILALFPEAPYIGDAGYLSSSVKPNGYGSMVLQVRYNYSATDGGSGDLLTEAFVTVTTHYLNYISSSAFGINYTTNSGVAGNGQSSSGSGGSAGIILPDYINYSTQFSTSKQLVPFGTSSWYSGITTKAGDGIFFSNLVTDNGKPGSVASGMNFYLFSLSLNYGISDQSISLDLGVGSIDVTLGVSMAQGITTTFTQNFDDGAYFGWGTTLSIMNPTALRESTPGFGPGNQPISDPIPIP